MKKQVMNPVVHFEMPAKNKKRMRKFYETTFGWKTQQLGKGMDEYVIVSTGERDEKTGFPQKPGMINGGFYTLKPDWPAQYPSVVIAVDDIQASMKKIAKSGGKVLGKPMDIPGNGAYVSFFDTEGNRVSIIQPLPMPEPAPVRSSNITTCLWFDHQAEQAARFYVKIFKEAGRSASIGKIARYGESGSKVSGQPVGKVMTIEFELDGQSFMGLNGGPVFTFSPATSFVIDCKTQKDVDYFWKKLGEKGKPGQCGWINADQYGIAWQVVPSVLAELMSLGDAKKSERMMKAMLSMKKLSINGLKKAYDQVS